MRTSAPDNALPDDQEGGDLSGLGTRIYQRRLELGIRTQTELAKLSDVPQATISKIEAGDTLNPGTRSITKIARALRTTPDWLRTGRGLRDSRWASLEPKTAELLETILGSQDAETILELSARILDLPPDRRQVLVEMLQAIARRKPPDDSQA